MLRSLIRLCVLILTIAPAISFADSRQVRDAGRLCENIFPINRWAYVDDEEVLSLAHDFTTQLGLPVIPVTCGGNGELFEFAAMGVAHVGNATYLFIGMNTDFRRKIGKDVRGVVAHEVAHQKFPDVDCCALPLQEYISCELAVDVVAERLAGKGAVVSSHIAVLQYIKEKYNQADIHTIMMQYTLRARLDALQK